MSRGDGGSCESGIKVVLERLCWRDFLEFYETSKVLRYEGRVR